MNNPSIYTWIRMSEIAKTGNNAEHLLVSSCRVHLERYFNRPISRMDVVPGRKKTDVRVTFEDGTTACIQNKNGHNSRGHHVHREDIHTFPCQDTFRQLFRSVCLKSGEPRCLVERDDTLLEHCLFGTEDSFVPDYLTHTDIQDNVIVYLSICPMADMMALLKQVSYRELHAKETQIYISPFVVVKRRGGANTDVRPDDIQVQLKIHDIVSMPLFKVLFQRTAERVHHIDDNAVAQVE